MQPMASPATQGLLGLRPPCRLWQSMEAIPADTDDRGREDVTRDLFLSPNRTGITRPIVSQNPQILLANFNQWYFNNLVKKPRHKTHCRCPHRLNLSFQSSRSCALPVSIRLTHGQKSAAEHHIITAPGLIGQDDRITLETRSTPIGQANAALVRFGDLPIEPSCTGFEVGEATL